MDANEFLRKIKRHAKANGLDVRLIESRGKGGHRILVVGNKSTTLIAKGKDIGPDLLRDMLKQLGIDRRGF